MPEIKNNFFQGKMNKDLDERLVPNGQYRHAENIEISTSEGSDVGTVQNILGNNEVGNNIPTTFKCIGSIADEKNNKIYWFLKADDKDAIVEYDTYHKSSHNVIVDLFKGTSAAVLEFTNKQITGINIVDDLLLWTDGNTEPRMINIKRCKDGCSALAHPDGDHNSFDHHSYLYIDGVSIEFLKKEHTTVIKKKPKTAPTIKIKKSNNTNRSGIFEKIFPRFALRYKYLDGQYSAIGPFTDVVFNPVYTGDYNVVNAFTSKESYNTAMVNSIESIDVFDFVQNDLPKDVTQIDILYKQENSTVVYSVDSIKKIDPEWSDLGSWGASQTEAGLEDPVNTSYFSEHSGKYTITTENIYAALPENQLLRPWDNVPTKALAQEITGNRVVYGNYTQGRDIVNILKEDVSPSLSGGYEKRFNNSSFADGGLKSIKSQRDYQLGVVFGDEYGRETPVFTSSNASVKVPWEDSGSSKNASESTILTSTLNTQLPYWAEYYKFYVKETSGEYYNLIMQNAYTPVASTEAENTDDHIWLSFNSSDRNKISEDGYLIIKKVVSPEASQIYIENRYKVLDISNEAPDAIAYGFANLGTVDNGTQPLTGNGVSANAIFSDTDRTIDKETDLIEINIPNWRAQGGMHFVETSYSSYVEHARYSGNIYISWVRPDTGEHSKRYKVDSIDITSQNVRVLKLNKKISVEDTLITGSNGTIFDTDLEFTIERKDRLTGEDFSGKFFIKVASDDVIKSNLLDGFPATTIDTNYNVDSTANLYWWADALTAGTDQTAADGVFNSESYAADPDETPNDIHSATLTNTEAAWDTLITHNDATSPNPFFIDNMFVRAVQTSNDTNYAKYAGDGFVGNSFSYQDISWGEWSYGDEFDADGNEISFIGFGTPNPVMTTDPLSNYLVTSPNYTTPANTTYPEFFITPPDSFDHNNIVNSIPGIVTSSNEYSENGAKAFVKNIGDSTSDETYKYVEGEEKFYMHISFPAPGVDLHDGTFPTDLVDTEVSGYNSIAKELQGIWGGGVFTSRQDQPYVVEFEGNYTPLGEPALTAPQPGVGKGYNLEYATEHERQWDPTYPSDPDGNIKRFVDNLKPGGKFRFSEDTSDEVYFIKSVAVKKLYNHTPWRTEYQYTGTTTNTLEMQNNSVEEAAVSWAYWSEVGDDAATLLNRQNTLMNRIKEFGQANNRRVCYIIEINKNPQVQTFNPVAGGTTVDGNSFTKFEFLNENPQALSNLTNSTPAIFETEPKSSSDLNIFYEAGDAIPTELNANTREIYAPRGSRVEFVNLPEARNGLNNLTETLYVRSWSDSEFNEATGEGGDNLLYVRSLDSDDKGFNSKDVNGGLINYIGEKIRFYKEDGSYVTSEVIGTEPLTDLYESINIRPTFIISPIVDPSLGTGIGWHNCFSFGDGIESNRIRDDYNEMLISNGVKVSTTIDEKYQEEQRKNGLIYSGLYSSTNGVNNLNQFIQAEKITKDVNPTYGSIQKLFSRKTDLVTLCEDKVLKILANKDALFNADGNAQLVASQNVLGQATPFVGDYGISKNPESFASESYRAYFTDSSRGAVLRLSMDGLTPISDTGMHDYFRDHLLPDMNFIGTYDDYKKQYNITLKSKSDFPNLIANAYIEDGDPLILQSTSLANFVENGVVGGGVEYTSSISNLFANQNMISNPNFSHKVRIRNFHPIPVGSIIAAVTGSEGQEEITEQGALLESAVGVTPAEAATYQDGDYRIHRAELEDSAPPHQTGTDGHPFRNSIGVSNQDNSNRVWLKREIKPSANPMHDLNGNTFVEYTGQNPSSQSSIFSTSQYANFDLEDFHPDNYSNYTSSTYRLNSPGSTMIDGYSGDSGKTIGNGYGTKNGWSPASWNGWDGNTNGGGTFLNPLRCGPKIFYDYGNVFNDENVSYIQGSTTSQNEPSGIVFDFVGKNEEARITYPNTWIEGSAGQNIIASGIASATYANTGVSPKNDTIFHGEVVEFSFKMSYEWSNYYGTFAFQDWKIEAFDGNTLISTSKLASGGWVVGGNYSSTPSNILTSHDIGSFLDQDNPSAGDQVSRTFTVKFEFKDPTLSSAAIAAGQTESIVVNDLKFRITLVGSNEPSWSGLHRSPPHVRINNLEILKTRRLQSLSVAYAAGSSAIYDDDIIIQEGIQAGTGAVDPVPSVAVPGWAQVDFMGEDSSQTNPEHWSGTNNINQVDFFYGTKQIYGDETGSYDTITEGGQSFNVPPGWTLANPTYTNDFVDYNQYVLGNGIDGNTYNESLIRIGDYGDNGSSTYGQKAKVKLYGFSVNTGAPTSASLFNDVLPSYQDQHWYLTDIEYDENYVSDFDSLGLRGVASYDTVTADDVDGQDAYGVSHEMVDHHSFDLYPTGSFGMIGGSSSVGGNKSILTMGAVRTEYDSERNVRRGIHQRVTNSLAYTFTAGDEILQGYACDVLIESFKRFDITDVGTMSAPPNWSTNQYNYTNFNDAGAYLTYTTNPHALQTVTDDSGETFQLAKPVSYYHDGSLCWNADDRSGRYWEQIGTMPNSASTEGYTFKFFIDENPYTNNNLSGALAIRGGNAIGSSYAADDSLASDEFYGFWLDNIKEYGDYIVNVNFDGSEPEIVLQPSTSNIIATSIATTSASWSTNTNLEDKILIGISGSGNVGSFEGSIKSISLVDATNFFSGGGVDFWTFGNDFNQEENNYIYWNTSDSQNQNSYLQLLNAPAGLTIEQNIDLGDGNAVGYSYRLQFDYDLGQEQIDFYYYTVNGGFSGSVTGSGTFNQLFTIGGNTAVGASNGQSWSNSSASEGELYNTFVITTATSSVTGSLDNFIMTREVLSEITEETLSFSEDVKGWVSFKSFIPESGLSINKQYYTMYQGQLWQHYTGFQRNNFYGTHYESIVDVILNASPSTVKSFNTLNYEGSQSRKDIFISDSLFGQFSNISIDNIIPQNKLGWEVETISTDMEMGSLKEFVEKEGKWFNYIKGKNHTDLPLDTSQFNVQGLGMVNSADADGEEEIIG